MDFIKEKIHLIPNWFRSSCLQIFYKIGVLENLAKFTRTYLCWGHFLTKLLVSRTETSLKRDSSTGFFCGFGKKILKTLFKEHLRMTLPVNFSVPTKVLSTDYTLFVFSFIFSLLLLIIAIIGVYSENAWKWRFFQ